jgi:hypothetical protein
MRWGTLSLGYGLNGDISFLICRTWRTWQVPYAYLGGLPFLGGALRGLGGLLFFFRLLVTWLDMLVSKQARLNLI